MTARRRTLALLALALLVPATLTGCRSNLAFEIDERIEILSPDDGEEVRLPMTVEWSARDYDGAFIVLVDRVPMRPDKTVGSLITDDDPCYDTSSCMEPAELAERGIFLTSSTSITIERLPDRRDDGSSKDRHDLTIVLADADGRRSGETAFVREFLVDREDG
ncbi:MAG TPA: hypothetical protein VM938_15975 [Acidimicrobiales bacterium]|nr:hypothetical protein [Acidimicrobiales bacterium]